uniref:Uncharacterized protein n=1 Tax=Helianthus annuus TaxID=4232 RepID=A0A251VDY4_HELAN
MNFNNFIGTYHKRLNSRIIHNIHTKIYISRRYIFQLYDRSIRAILALDSIYVRFTS